MRRRWKARRAELEAAEVDRRVVDVVEEQPDEAKREGAGMGEEETPGLEETGIDTEATSTSPSEDSSESDSESESEPEEGSDLGRNAGAERG